MLGEVIVMRVGHGIDSRIDGVNQRLDCVLWTVEPLREVNVAILVCVPAMTNIELPPCKPPSPLDPEQLEDTC